MKPLEENMMKCFKCDDKAEYIVEGYSICYDHFVQRFRTKTFILKDSCICSPDESNDRRSVCGFPCKAQWHWGDEFTYYKKKGMFL